MINCLAPSTNLLGTDQTNCLCGSNRWTRCQEVAGYPVGEKKRITNVDGVMKAWSVHDEVTSVTVRWVKLFD